MLVVDHDFKNYKLYGRASTLVERTETGFLAFYIYIIAHKYN